MNWVSINHQRLSHYLRPNMAHETIFDIDFLALRNRNINHLMFDVDNTIISYSETEASLQAINLFNQISSIGFSSVILVSNNSNKDRIERIAKQLKRPSVTFACKPFVFTARQILSQYRIPANECAMIGDQLLTDILMANYMGMTSIYVEPLDTTNVSILKKWQYQIQHFALLKL